MDSLMLGCLGIVVFARNSTFVLVYANEADIQGRKQQRTFVAVVADRQPWKQLPPLHQREYIQLARIVLQVSQMLPLHSDYCRSCSCLDSLAFEVPWVEGTHWHWHWHLCSLLPLAVAVVVAAAAAAAAKEAFLPNHHRVGYHCRSSLFCEQVL